MKKVKFIYNPSSGETGVHTQLDEIIEVYQRHGYSLTPYRLDFKADPGDMTWDVTSRFHHILVAGGDGTINYVVNHLKKEGLDIPVAVLPAGTANDFASMLKIPADPVKACEKLLAGNIVPIDLGKVNDTWFVNVFSCGLFTDISQKTPTVLKNTFGKLAYYVGGLGELSKFRKMRIKIKTDGGDFDGKCVIFFVFNGRTAGNLKIAYLSEIDDGLLDVLIFKGDNPVETVQTVMQYLTNLGPHDSYPPGIVHMRCSHLHAECDTDEPTDIDGQAGPGFPLDIVCEKGGLRMLLPKPAEKKQRRTRKKTGQRS